MDNLSLLPITAAGSSPGSVLRKVLRRNLPEVDRDGVNDWLSELPQYECVGGIVLIVLVVLEGVVLGERGWRDWRWGELGRGG